MDGGPGGLDRQLGGASTVAGTVGSLAPSGAPDAPLLRWFELQELCATCLALPPEGVSAERECRLCGALRATDKHTVASAVRRSAAARARERAHAARAQYASGMLGTNVAGRHNRPQRLREPLGGGDGASEGGLGWGDTHPPRVLRGRGGPRGAAALANRAALTSSAAAANFNLRLFLAHACFAARVMAVLLEWPCRPTDWRRWVDVRDTWNAAVRHAHELARLLHRHCAVTDVRSLARAPLETLDWNGADRTGHAAAMFDRDTVRQIRAQLEDLAGAMAALPEDAPGNGVEAGGGGGGLGRGGALGGGGAGGGGKVPLGPTFQRVGLEDFLGDGAPPRAWEPPAERARALRAFRAGVAAARDADERHDRSHAYGHAPGEEHLAVSHAEREAAREASRYEDKPDEVVARDHASASALAYAFERKDDGSDFAYHHRHRLGEVLAKSGRPSRGPYYEADKGNYYTIRDESEGVVTGPRLGHSATDGHARIAARGRPSTHYHRGANFDPGTAPRTYTMTRDYESTVDGGGSSVGGGSSRFSEDGSSLYSQPRLSEASAASSFLPSIYSGPDAGSVREGRSVSVSSRGGSLTSSPAVSPLPSPAASPRSAGGSSRGSRSEAPSSRRIWSGKSGRSGRSGRSGKSGKSGRSAGRSSKGSRGGARRRGW